MVTFRDLFISLESLGLTDVLLPFVLVFTIVYAVAHKVELLGKNKKFHIVLAMIMGFVLVIGHVKYGTSNPNDGRLINGMPDGVEVINNSLPSISVIAVAIIMLLLMLGLWGGNSKHLGATLGGWIGIFSFGTIIYIFGASAGWWPLGLLQYVDADTMALLLIVLVFGVIIWFVTKDDSEAKKASHVSDLFSDFGKLFGGGGGGGHGGH